MLVTLHNVHGQEIIIRLDLNDIESIQPVVGKNMTCIELKFRKRYYVQESPKEVLELVKNPGENG